MRVAVQICQKACTDWRLLGRAASFSQAQEICNMHPTRRQRRLQGKRPETQKMKTKAGVPRHRRQRTIRLSRNEEINAPLRLR